MTPQTLLYQETITRLQNSTTLIKKEIKANTPQDYIVATHGPTLA
jgi:hypothetical protein